MNAAAKPYLPPKGKIFAGVSGGEYPSGYNRQTRAHAAVFQTFTLWGYRPDRVLARSIQSRARPMIHISTAGPRGEVITPRAIARGKGDGYLRKLNKVAASTRHPFYIRLFAEMNGHWNPYCAFNANGSSRGPSHSTKNFRRAWRRVVRIVRGGGRTGLPKTKASFLWVPQVAGAPDTRANSPRAYWPGKRYVDWVGTDFYSKFPNWSGLARLYAAYPGKPFVFGEWAVWGGDSPGFVHALFGWVERHGRTRMLMYNHGVRAGGPFRLSHYPQSRRALASELRSGRYPSYAPDFK
jgi:hypothetical protein